MQTWNEVAFNELAIPVILFLPSKEKQRKLDSFGYSIVLIVDWMMTRMGGRSGSVNILNTLGSGLTSQQSLAWIEHAAIQTNRLFACSQGKRGFIGAKWEKFAHETILRVSYCLQRDVYIQAHYPGKEKAACYMWFKTWVQSKHIWVGGTQCGQLISVLGPSWPEPKAITRRQYRPMCEFED